MRKILKAHLHSVTFTDKGAKVVLECSTGLAITSAREVSKMVGGEVMAEFDDGQEALPFEEDEDIEEGQGEFALPGDEETPPFVSEPDGTVSAIIDVPVEDDDDEDIGVID